MTVCEVTPRRWGNSVGIILSQDVIEAEGIEIDKPTSLLIIQPGRIPRHAFGMIKKRPRKSTQKILNEINEELDYE